VKRITVKVGSAVLTREGGTLDVTRLSAIVDQIAILHKNGYEVILVSSGAVASGRGELHLGNAQELDTVGQRQLFSAVGQAKLINRYYDFFSEHHLHVGQVLTQKSDFDSPEHLRNMQTCMNVMLENGVIPVVNENDTVSVAELMFTDNDELSGLIARMMKVDTLIILSNIDGLYDGDPKAPGTNLIHKVLPGNQIEQYIQTEKTVVGRGGMQSKCTTALEVASSGIDVYIARGTRENVLTDLILSEARIPHTHFVRR